MAKTDSSALAVGGRPQATSYSSDRPLMGSNSCCKSVLGRDQAFGRKRPLTVAVGRKRPLTVAVGRKRPLTVAVGRWRFLTGIPCVCLREVAG